MRRALALTGLVSLLLLLPIPLGLSDLAGGDVFRMGKDKLVHAALFALLGWAWTAALAPARARRALAVLAALVGWGGVLELAQRATGWRSAEAGDLLADAVGIALGIAVALRRRSEAALRGTVRSL